MATKSTSPAPAPVASQAAAPAPVQGVTVQGVALPAPTGPLYVCNEEHPAWNRVGPGSHRAYAQSVAAVLTKAMPNGFALNQYRAALVGNVLPANHPQRNIPAPTHGWLKHNMPTWSLGQGWLKAAPTK